MNKIIDQINKQQANSHILDDVNERKALLKKLKQNILDNEALIYEAFLKDLNKSKKETYLVEVSETIAEIEYFLKHLSKWIKTKKIKNSYQTYGCKCSIKPRPQGKVLIIVPFNYPLSLCLMPLIGAIGAGNRVLIKLSEWTNNINIVIQKIIKQTFSKQIVDVILDKDLKNYNEIYEYEPQLVFFTGSTKVGKIIETECVKRNINYITELGGKCPCYVESVKSPAIYERIVWSKFINAGQTCVGINHIFYNQNISNFRQDLINEINRQYPNVLQNMNMPKIINKNSFDRLVKIINENKSNIIYGGNYNKNKLMIEPTIIEVDLSQIKKYDEIFGPILFITKTNKSVDYVVESFNEIDNSPLAAYIYSTNKLLIDTYINNINAGGYGINDSVIHLTNPKLPFGGVYTSGTGCYHGKYSFDNMSFLKPILENKSKKNLPIKFINNNFSYEKAKKIIKIIKKFF